MAILMRRPPLEVVARTKCPAALPIYGATPDTAGVICRVMQIDRSKERGAGYTPGQLALSRDDGAGVFLTAKGDPSTIERFCCSDADVPVLHNGEMPSGRDHFSYCPCWQAEKERIEDGRDLLAGGGLEPESVESYDVTPEMRSAADATVAHTVAQNSHDADDPWAQARRDLDELAPPT